MNEGNASSLILITGGVRSGKSTFAEKLASESGKEIIYLATARVEDEEMEDRVKRHRERRPSGVITVEEALEPHLVLDGETSPDRFILVDCLTLLITNRFLAYIDSHGAVRKGEDIYADEKLLQHASSKTLDYINSLANSAVQCPATVAIVTNEVGMGVVPNYPVGRVFRDLSGRANQTVAALADQLWLVVCGIPQRIK